MNVLSGMENTMIVSLRGQPAVLWLLAERTTTPCSKTETIELSGREEDEVEKNENEDPWDDNWNHFKQDGQEMEWDYPSNDEVILCYERMACLQVL